MLCEVLLWRQETVFIDSCTCWYRENSSWEQAECQYYTGRNHRENGNATPGKAGAFREMAEEYINKNDKTPRKNNLFDLFMFGFSGSICDEMLELSGSLGPARQHVYNTSKDMVFLL